MIRRSQRLRGQKVCRCAKTPREALIGTHGRLFLLKGALTRFTTKDGLPSNKIHFITEDAQVLDERPQRRRRGLPARD